MLRIDVKGHSNQLIKGYSGAKARQGGEGVRGKVEEIKEE